MLIGNKFVLACKEKAKLFNDFFVEQCQPFQNSSKLPETMILLTEAKLDSINIVDQQILDILRSFKVNKAHGPENISVNMIKLCVTELIVPLSLIFKNILATGIIPDQWKRANVTPVHKKEDKQLVKNYRPISLLLIFAKVFEGILFSELYKHLIDNNLIIKNQSGFRPGESVTNQLTYLVQKIYSSFDDRKTLEVRSIYLDMSKAFRKVWHEGLLFKLEQNGVTGNLLKLLSNYLTGRKQRVVLNGMESDWGDTKSGVTQESVLAPLLFLIYINDLEKGIKSPVKFFADDISLFSIASDPKLSANELNHDLKLIEKWAFQWEMRFNPAEEIIFFLTSGILKITPKFSSMT